MSSKKQQNASPVVVEKVTTKTTMRKGALKKQKDRSSVQTLPKAQFQQPTTRYLPRHQANGSCIVEGRDYVGSFTIRRNTGAGDTFFNVDLNPLGVTFSGTRLARLASTFEKYKYSRLYVSCVASTGTDGAGTYLIAYDPDMADNTPPRNVAGLQEYFAMQNTQESVFWRDAHLNCKLTRDVDPYYTNYTGREGRLSSQGQLYGAVVSPYEQDCTYTLYIEYIIEFTVPGLENLQPDIDVKAPLPGTNINVSNNVTSLFNNKVLNGLPVNPGLEFIPYQAPTDFNLNSANSGLEKSISLPPGTYKLGIDGSVMVTSDLGTGALGDLQTAATLIANLSSQRNNVQVNPGNNTDGVNVKSASSAAGLSAGLSALTAIAPNMWKALSFNLTKPTGSPARQFITNWYELVVPVGGAILNTYLSSVGADPAIVKLSDVAFRILKAK